MAKKHGLSAKQFAFCEAYLETLNATEAARRAKYQASSAAVFGVIGHENLRKPKIKAYIEARLGELTMPAEEVLVRLSQQAKGADVTDFAEMVTIHEIGEDGEKVVSDIRLNIDLEKIHDLGLGHLIKKISQTGSGISIEWHNPQKALELLGKYHKLFTEKIEHGVSDEMQQHVENFNKLAESIYGNSGPAEPDQGR